MSIEIESLLKVGIGLSEIAEAELCVEVLCDVILGIELYEYLRNFLYNHIVGIDAHGLSVAKRHAGVIVFVNRLLIGEEGVHVEILERVDLGRCGPAQGLYVVDEQHGLAL